jgi:hypothetical protein
VQAVRVTIPAGPKASVRLCYQWALECEDLSSPFDTQVCSALTDGTIPEQRDYLTIPK